MGDSQIQSGGLALGAFDAAAWKGGADWVGGVLGSKVLLAAGLAGVGLSVKADSFRAAGLRPFAVGGTGALLVGGVGLTVATIVSRMRQPASGS